MTRQGRLSGTLVSLGVEWIYKRTPGPPPKLQGNLDVLPWVGCVPSIRFASFAKTAKGISEIQTDIPRTMVKAGESDC